MLNNTGLSPQSRVAKEATESNHLQTPEATSPDITPFAPALQGFLAGGGEMGERIRSLDWSKTPLGPVESWPQSLKTAVRIILTSRQPMFVWWGQELINLYNDAYKAIVGGKHPQALGQPAEQVWREIWDQVGPRAEWAIQKNEGTYDEALLLIMERNGYPEETYYTFSYSPIPGDNDQPAGIICANTDYTQGIIGERQLKLLRELAAGTVDARTIAEACQLSAAYLAHNPYDLPFAMIYLVDQSGQNVSLAGTCGIEAEHPAVPQSVNLDTDVSEWPFAEAISTNKPCLVAKLDDSFGPLPTGAWARPPHQAVVVPIPRSGQTGQGGLLVVGLNPFRLFDEGYAGFINLVATQIGTSIASAQALEEERKRAEALAEIDRAKTTFFSNVSHEFRTPLTLMLGPIEDMLSESRTDMSEDQRLRVETLHRNALRLLKLVNALLDFSRIEAGRVQAVYEPTNLAALTTDLASSFRSAVEKAGMELVVDCPSLAEPVYVDQDMWEKIVLNLVSNAFKYTLAGRITVSLRQVGQAVELKVADTGLGIAAEELPHIFERFHRVEGVQGRTYEGTGIGLSLVQELVRLHGGSIGVESQPGRGSAFTVSLPLGLAHLPAERISARRTLSSTAMAANTYVEEALRWLPQSGQSEGLIADLPLDLDGPLGADKSSQPGSAGKARLLLADDNADMREYVTRLLAQRYAVTAVADGREALAAARQTPFDLVLTDVMMPNLDGFGLLRELRTDPRTSTTPVIMLSARAGEEATSEGMEAGADDYLVKPFSARELLARVGAHLEMAHVRREAARQIQEMEQRLASVVTNSPIVLWALDKDGVYTLSEGKGLEALGVKPGEIVGQSHFQLYKDLPTVLEPVRRALTGETTVAVVGLEGFWFETTYSPSYDEHGEVNGIVAVSTDITERKKAEEAREAALRQLRTILERMPAGVLIGQVPDGQIVLSNPQVAKIWRETPITTGQLAHEGAYKALHNDGRLYQPEDWPMARALFRGETLVDEEMTILRGDGTTGTISVGAAPITNEQGQITAAVVVFIDISERKELEKQKDEFIAIASHELKTPVTSLKAYGQALQTLFRRKGETKAVEQLTKMDTQINKLTLLIRDLLDVTKLQAGKLQFQQDWFDFNTLVDEIVEELQRTTEQHIILKELGPTRLVYGDRDRTGQVLTNLLSNAIKYSPQAAEVVVQSRLENDQLVLSVQDFGIGIAPEKQAHIFERFYRVSGPNQETFPGLGLGLYISSQIIARQNGKIWLESRPGAGSTFYFSLPVQS